MNPQLFRTVARPGASTLVAFALVAACGAKSTSRWDRNYGASGAGGSGGAGTSSASAGTTGGGGTAPNGDAGEPGNPGGDGGAGPIQHECGRGIPATSQIPLLTPEQYDRTVRDLLGVEALAAHDGAPPSSLLARDSGERMTPAAWAGYTAAAAAIARQVMADASVRPRFYDCPAGAAASDCLRDSIVDFGRRAFRRPLTAAEVARFEVLVARGAEITETGAPEEIAEALLETFLVSPSFLQRAELSEEKNEREHFVLSSYEVASRLSYVIWGSTPDAELDRAADSDELRTAREIRAQAERMVADPKARDGVGAFHRYYVGNTWSSPWRDLQKDPEVFPDFDAAVARALTDELERFFAALVFEERAAFRHFFTSTAGFVNADTAALYGLDPADFGAELERVELDPAQRPGFVTRAGFLAAHSGYSRSSAIRRGAFVTQEIIGLFVGMDPPWGPAPGPLDLDTYPTDREAEAALTAGPACAVCHETYLNPPGFVLEAYDAAGAWRTVEGRTGAPLDTAAVVYVDGAQVPVANPAELMAVLAQSSEVRKEYARDWIEFAHGRPADPLDECVLDELALRLTDDGYGVLDLILELTQADTFRLRTLEVSP